MRVELCCEGSLKGLRTEPKESEEVSGRDGFEDTHIVRFEQAMKLMVSLKLNQTQELKANREDLLCGNGLF